MTSQQKCFDLLFLLAGRQFCISKATRQIDRGIVISVIAVAADTAAERLLIGSIRAVEKWQREHSCEEYAALTGCARHSAFGSRPSQLLRDMREMGSIQVGVHGSSFEAHGGHGKILINNPGISGALKHLIDG